jgi:hypothetical protein
MANGSQTVSAVITADAKPFKRAVQDAGGAFDGFGRAAQGFGIIAAAAFAAASAAAITFLADSVKAAAEAEAVARGLENAAENAGVFASQAGGIAGATEALKKYTQQLGITIGKDDEKLQEIVTGWLAVPDLASLGVEGLENLLKVAADVAAGTGKDLDSVAGAFTKVAGDGETALSKLLRQGIVFTDEQKKVYESLIESNDELGAQAFLIETLGDKYEGAAEAVANPFDQLAEIFKNFQETVGAQLLPVLEDLVPQIQAFFDELASDPEFIKFLEDMVDEFVKMAPELKDLVPKMLDLAKVAIPAMITLLPKLVDIVTLFNEALGEGEFSLDEFKGFLEAIFTPLSILIGILGIVIEVVKEVWDRLARADILTKIVNPIANAKGAFDALADAIQLVIDAWNTLFGTQQSKPIRNIGSADSLERQLTAPPRYADDMRRPLTYNISVNAIAPTAEVGRAVVDSLQAYQRIGGSLV